MKVLKADEVQVLPRGRRATFDGDFVKVLSGIKAGTFALLENGDVPGATLPAMEANDRSKVSSIVRKHWEKAHGSKPTIRWTSEGFPQVGASKA